MTIFNMGRADTQNARSPGFLRALFVAEYTTDGPDTQSARNPEILLKSYCKTHEILKSFDFKK